MLRCCNSRRHFDAMECTEPLKIETGKHGTITNDNKVRNEDAQVRARKENAEEKKNKEVDNKTSHEMSDNKPSDNRINDVEEVCEKGDDECEKVDSSKEEDDDDGGSDSENLETTKYNDMSTESVENDDISYSEDISVDNNTFNIINTENSESQEISELTNDESSPPPTDCSKSALKENGDEGSKFRGNDDSIYEGETEESHDEVSVFDEEDIIEEEEEEEEECDMTEESVESDCEDIYSGSDVESDDEGDFDNDSLEDTESKADIESKVDTESKPENKSEPAVPIKQPQQPLPSVVTTAKSVEPKPSSPKFRHRVRSFSRKDRDAEFKIEIFESKRPQNIIPRIESKEESKTKCNSEVCKDNNCKSITEKTSAKGFTTRGECAKICPPDQVPGPDVPSPCSDLTTPDSADNSVSVLLDVSQVTKEDVRDSQRFSPMRSPEESCVGGCNRMPADTNRKSNPETVEATSVTSPATRPVSLASTTTSTTTTTTTTAVSTNSPTTTTTTTTSNHNSPRDGGAEDLSNSSGGEASADIKKPSPMAFTIELGNTTSGGVETPAKKLDITASISKWAPKHRRNLSLTKVEENKKVEERIGKPPVGRPRSGTIGATGLMQTQGRRAGGYHSEGYFSSDQDDEIPRRTDLKSPRSPRTPELRSPQTPQRVVRSSSQDSAKGASVKKTAGKPEGRTCCKSDKKPTVAEVTGRAKSEKGTKSTSKMTPEARKQSNSANSLSSCQTYDVKQELERNVPGKEEKDDVSEAGTYTIEKDSSSPEVEQARNDIDRVFGVSGTESETEITPRANMQPDETWTATPEPDKFKSPGSLSRNSPNWIQQWAAQVAEHTKSPDTSSKISLASPRGLKPPMASLSSSQESSESRPRRKLPTPPTHHSPFALTSPRASDMSDHESPTKGSKHRRELYETPCGGQHESSFNTESFLRETEQLVTSLQARVDMNKGISPGLRGSSFESRDSGGDSDLDTSTSYPINDDDDHLMKTVGLQLKTKLKLSGIGDATKTPPVVASPRKNDPLGLETRLKLANNFKRERSIVSDSGYEVYANRREENSLQSDSSSEASEPVKDSRKTIDNNPPLKFNRAFSLRRARLTCDDSSQQHQSPSPLDKKKNTRPVTSGNLSGNRKVPLGSSKSHQNHQSSDSTRGGSHSHIPTSKGGSTDFSRGDGGRFSLRLPRSGSSNTVSKSPSHTSVRKELSSNSRRGTPRSNSTLSAKEVDFQNWKRRKNYDPMKAAAEGRKKVTDKKSDKTNQCHSLNAPERGTPSPPGSLLRSASFHGTEGMAVSGRWPRRPNHLYTSEDDGPYSLEEEHPRRVPNCSPLRRSPTSPHQLASPHTTSPARQATLAAARARRSSFTHSDEGEGQPASPNRKTSLDESGSEGKRSPMGSTRGTVSSRSKAKMEALDNLVISTIHSLSVKVRTTSETLLQKLKSQYDEEGDRAALLEEVLAHLSESDQTLVTGQSRSTSRELAGILRNLKKIEHALEVIDRVMVCDDEDDLDEDDLDGTVGQEWGSDY